MSPLSYRANYFITCHSRRVDVPPLDRERWRAAGVRKSEIDRATDFHERWGGTALPPSLASDGGPRWFAADLPTGAAGADRFDAGRTRSALPYTFDIGPAGEFGIGCGGWTVLNESVEGWIESLALAYYASVYARTVTSVIGDVDLSGLEPVPEVRGVADNWWRGPTTLVSVHGGMADYYDQPDGKYCRVYEDVIEGILSLPANHS